MLNKLKKLFENINSKIQTFSSTMDSMATP